MDRKNNLRAFERGVRAMMDQGIQVKVDLIVGLPGDTVQSVRRGLHYLHDSGLYSDLQVFNLSILPGTAFRQEAEQLGLKFQPRPPYYVLQTPTLSREDLYGLMYEAQDLFGMEFDAQPAPVLDVANDLSCERIARLNLGEPVNSSYLDRSQAYTLWLQSSHFDQHCQKAAQCIRRVLDGDPFTTLQVVLEPLCDSCPEVIEQALAPRVFETLTAACQASPTYLDRFYALQPGRPNGAKRLIALLPASLRPLLAPQWLDKIGAYASLVWHHTGTQSCSEDDFAAHEYAWAPQGLQRTAG
jgi:hypothetical protein